MKPAVKIALALSLLVLVVAGSRSALTHAKGTLDSAHRAASARSGAWPLVTAQGDITSAPAPPRWFGQAGVAPGRIAGRVTIDGRPAAHAEVTLSSDLSEAGLFPERRVVTAADGSFDFGYQIAERYSVVASAPRRVPALAVADLRDPNRRAASEHLPLSLEKCDGALAGTVRDAGGGVIAGARIRRIERGPARTDPWHGAGEVRSSDRGQFELCLVPSDIEVAVEASGYGGIVEQFTVHGKLQRDFVLLPEVVLPGRVVRADGVPVPDALVTLLVIEQGLRRGVGVRAVSDADGRFTLKGVSAGRYGLIAASDDLRSGSVVEIAVEAARTAPEITLHVEPVTTVRGTVRANGQPVAGASVYLRSTVVATRWSNVVISQADGTFSLSGVSAGPNEVHIDPYEVISPRVFSATIGAPASLDVEVSLLGIVRGRVVRAGRSIEGAFVRAGQHRPVRSGTDGSYEIVGLSAGHYVIEASSEREGAFGKLPAITLGKGEVRSATDVELSAAGAISGSVVDAKGVPVAGVAVFFTRIDNNDDNGSATTDTSGRFLVTELAGGDYRASVRSSESTTAEISTDQPLPTITVANGATRVEGVRLEIRRSRSTISGSVVDGAGAPRSDVHIVALRLEGGAPPAPGWNDSWVELPHTFSLSDGTFSIRDIDDDQYTLKARAGDGSEALISGIAAGQSGVVVRLEATGTIVGTLVGFHQAPEIMVMRLASEQYHPPIFAFVDGEGFRVPGLVPGRYQLATTGAAEGDTAIVEVASGARATATLRSHGSARVLGRVTELSTGAPVEGLRCVASLRTGQRRSISIQFLPGESWTDADGHFELSTVPAGDVAITCSGSSDQVSDGIAPLTLTDGQVATTEIPVVRRRGTGALSAIGARGDVSSIAYRFVSVDPGGAAARAGIAPGDTIVSVDGASVERLSYSGVNLLAFDRPIGAPLVLGLEHSGGRVTARLNTVAPSLR